MSSLFADPAYRVELERLDALVADYAKARAADNDVAVMLLLGMMTAQHAVIYKLSPPAGLIDVAAMFVRDEEALRG